MKRIVRLFNYVICFILCIFSITSINALETKFKGLEKLSFEQKIYSYATIEQEFDGSSVLVVMDRNIGGINKKHKEDFFGTFQKKSIIDLTQVNGKAKNTKIDVENFRQIIKIELPTDNKENVLKVIKELENIEGIKYAGPNYYEYPSDISNTAFFENLNNTCADNENSPESVNPNDPSFESQWGLTKIQAQNAWDISYGSHSVRVGVIDTGISNHPDLNGNLTSGWDFYNNNNITNDDIVGHGTACWRHYWCCWK